MNPGLVDTPASSSARSKIMSRRPSTNRVQAAADAVALEKEGVVEIQDHQPEDA